MALEGKQLRMVLARQAKYKKQGNTYRDIPPDHKLHAELEKTLTDEIAINSLLLHLQDKRMPVAELSKLLDIPLDSVIDYAKKLEKKHLIESDRLIIP
jgi:hypothetical protein